MNIISTIDYLTLKSGGKINYFGFLLRLDPFNRCYVSEKFNNIWTLKYRYLNLEDCLRDLYNKKIENER
jgi:hypothetical protein